MTEGKSKMELKVRHSHMLREKINLLPIQMEVALQSIKQEIQTSKNIVSKMTEGSENHRKTNSLIDHGKTKNSFYPELKHNQKFWTSSIKFHEVSKKINCRRILEQKTKNSFSWNHLLVRSQSLMTKKVKERMNRFEHCCLIISETVRKLQEEQDKLVLKLIQQL